MKKLLIFVLVFFAIVACENKKQPEFIVCDQCLDEPLIYDACQHSCNCHHVISDELLCKYTANEDVELLIVGGKCSPTGGTGAYWGSPDWYYVKTKQAKVSDEWNGALIENLQFEEGYEYVIFARCELVQTSDDTFHPKYTYLEVISRNNKKPYNLPE